MTIAKQLNIKTFPFYIKDSNGNQIYIEFSDGYWSKQEYADGNLIRCEDSNGYWIKYEFDADGNPIYRENSSGYWEKKEWDTGGNVIYFETSHGLIKDNRPKTDVQKAIDLLTKEGLIVDGQILKN